MPPSLRAAQLGAAHPHRMHERLCDPAANLPRQPFQGHGLTCWQLVDAVKTSPRALLRDGGFGVVTGTGTSKHPFPPIVLTERRAQAGVIAPRLELAHGSVAYGGEPVGFPAIVHRAGRERLAGEPFVDQGADVLVEQDGADARLAFAASCRAAVADEAVVVDLALEHVATCGAAGYPGEQPVLVAAAVVAVAADLVGLLPQRPVDERRPGVLDAQSSWPDEHAEGGFGAHDAADGRHRPALTAQWCGDGVTGQAVGDLAPADPLGALGEDPVQDGRGLFVDDGLPVAVAGVAVGGLAGVASRLGGATQGAVEAFVGLVSLPFGHDQKQAEHGASYRCGGVDVLGDGHDPCAVLVQPVDRGQSGGDVAGEAVELGDDDPAGQSLVDTSERFVHAGAVHGAAGAVEVFVPCCDLDAVGVGPGLDRVALLGGRLEAFAGAPGDLRDADVSVHDGWWLAVDSGIVHSDVSHRRPVTMADRLREAGRYA